MKIYTIWPADKNGNPGGSWRQMKRWLVLDVTNGMDDIRRVFGPVSREEALAEELRLRLTIPVSGKHVTDKEMQAGVDRLLKPGRKGHK
jgi:hypothetical protein